MAPCNVHSANGTTSTPPKLVVTLPPTIAHYNGTLQWHHVHSAKVGHLPNHSTLQCHHVHPQSWSSPSPPPIAHYNGTLQWHPAMAPRPLNHSTQWHHVHSTIAHYNGTLQWHHVHCTLQWHSGATSNAQKWFLALPPYWK